MIILGWLQTGIYQKKKKEEKIFGHGFFRGGVKKRERGWNWRRAGTCKAQSGRLTPE